MATDNVKIRFKIEAAGGDVPDDIRKALEGVGNEADAVTSKAEKLSSTFFKMNQVVEGVQNIAGAFSTMNGVISGYTSSYMSQISAESRLQQVMKNTMDASEGEIAAIKELASAQQALGVIGDEVQLAGAQELATYMEKADSLKKLIPVLNDVVAQQYGYNATAEGAVSIATMMGKVFEGQTSALSRYGYSFSEAEDAVLKFGTEEEKAATLAEVVSRSVGGVNEALAATPTGAFVQLTNNIGDMKEKIGEMLMPLQGVMSVLSDTGQAAAGIVQLGTAISTLTKVTGIASAATKVWSVVQAALNAVMSANPISLVILAVGALVAGIVALYKNCESFRNMCNAVWEVIKVLGQVIWAIVKGAFEAWLANVKLVIKAVRQLCEWIGESAFGKAVKKFVAWIKDGVIKIFDKVTATIKVVISWLKRLFNIEENQTVEAIEATNEALKEEAINIEEVAARINEQAAAEKALAEAQKAASKASSSAIKEQIEAKQQVIELVKGQYGYEQQEIAKLNKQLEQASGAEIERIYLQISALQKLIDKREEALKVSAGTSALSPAGVSIPAAVELPDSSALNDYLKRQKDLFNDKAREQAEAYRTVIGSISGTFNELGSAIGGTAGQWVSWAGSMVSSIGKAIPALMSLIAVEGKEAAIGAASSVSAIPIVGPILAVAAVASVVASLLSIPKFAQGGLAYGPTLGLFGEYQGARSNPEVIAPLSKLQDMIAGSGGGRVELFIDGRNLRGVLSKVDNYRSRI